MGRPRTEDTTTLSIRLPVRLYEQISRNAEQQGMTRTEYFLSWLPENHTRAAANHQNNGNKTAR